MSKLRLITVFLLPSSWYWELQHRFIPRRDSPQGYPFGFRSFHSGAGCTSYCVGEANKASDKDGRFSLKVKVTDKAGSYTLTAVRVPQGSKYMLASPSKGKRLFISANDLEVSLITPEEKEMEYKKRYELLKEKYEEQSLSLRKLRNELNKRLGELSESDVHYARLKASVTASANFILITSTMRIR